MITLSNLTMGFTQRTLFKDVTFSIFPQEKIGLTGPNGAGKTTLFSIILKETEPLSGEVQIQKNINIGHLPQESKFNSPHTVIEELTEGDSRIKALTREKRTLEEAMKADTPRYGDILEELEQLGIYELENKAEQILSGLGFKSQDFTRPIRELSGGWQMRTLLAKLLVYPFDLLLLDEPTNYLDLEATLWLKDFLARYEGAFILISHDRVFLNDVTNYTIVLDGAQMTKVKGNYATYEAQKDINLRTLEKKQKVIGKRREQLERFTERFHAQPNRASAVRNKRKMIERLEEIDLPSEHKSIKEFKFSDIQSSGYVVAHLNQVAKSYAEKKVYENLDLEVIRGQKLCLVGPNGAGKSTLLKMLAGVIAPDAGQIKYGHQVELGYFSQTRLDSLNPERTAFEEVVGAGPEGIQAVQARSLLGLFNFHGDDVFKSVKILSGGEKSRVILAKLLIHPPNFMLLDEPTTHLDLDGIKALTLAFKEYQGTMVFISHDLYFIKEISNYIAEVNNKTVKVYPGGLDYYLQKRRENEVLIQEKENALRQEEKRLKVENSKRTNQSVDPKIAEAHRRHQEALERLSQIKNEIKRLCDEAKELETESYVKSRQLSNPSFFKDQVILKEYGQRLKWIQNRQREIESTLRERNEEKERISRG